MKTLFIGKRFYTNRDALKERYGRIYQLPYNWQRAGHETRLWLVDYHSSETVDTSEDGLIITSTPVRNWSFFKQLITTFFRKNDKPVMIVASGDCYIGFMAYLLSRWLRTKFVFDIYDRYDEFSGYRRLLWWDPLTFLRNQADSCLFASSRVPDSLGGYRTTDLIVPNGVDLEHFKPLDKNTCRQALGIADEKLLVGYFGSMEPDRGIDDLLEAISLLVDQAFDIRLLIAGKSNAETNLHRPYVKYLGNVPYRTMPTVLGCCDLLAVPYRRSAMMDAGASNKIIEYIASGRPIVATRTPNLLENFVDDEEFLSHIAEPGDPTSLSQCIKRALDCPIELSIPEGHLWPEISNRVLASLLPKCTTEEVTQ